MAPAFSKEAILLGSVDHLCLACESHLRSDRELSLHVATADHSRNLRTTDYVDNFRQDRIRKVKKWYLCEFCNVLVSTITKVRLHVEEIRHRDIMTSQMLSRVGDVVLFGDIAIQEDTWHGFIDEQTCALCNVEFENKDDHRSETSHIIHLIQSKVSDDLGNVYRKINDFTFHCLTCNKVVREITSHVEDTNHVKHLKQSINIKSLRPKGEVKNENLSGESSRQCANENIFVDETNPPKKNSSVPLEVEADVRVEEEVKNVIDPKNNITGDLNSKTLSAPHNCENILTARNGTDQKANSNAVTDNCTTDILESIHKFQKANIDVNFESHTAVCRRCSVTLELDYKLIQSHIEEDKNNLQNDPNQIKNSGKTKLIEKFKEKVDDGVQNMAEEHGFTYVSTGKKVCCQKCNKHVPATIKNIDEHVKGELHKKNVKLSDRLSHLRDNDNKKIDAKKYNLQKIPMNLFMKTLTTVKNIFAQDAIVNEKYCINMLTFIFLTMTAPGRFRCQVCEVNLSVQDIKHHLDLKRHDRAMTEISVIINIEAEFIREIRSDLYQCGYCNIYDSAEGMESHLKSTEHKESKAFANWRLAQHLPQIEQHRVERQIHNEFLMRLMFS